MKSNFNIVVSFFSNDTNFYAVFSTEKDVVTAYGLENNWKLINSCSIIIRSIKDSVIHKYLQDNNIFSKVIVAKSVKNKEQLQVWLKVKAGVYSPESDWDKFLVDNNLLNDWIDGKLVIENANYYYESSKEFGNRRRLKKDTLRLMTHDLWLFADYFKGEKTTTYGYSAKFRYDVISKIIKISNQEKNLLLNKDWIQEIESQSMNW